MITIAYNERLCLIERLFFAGLDSNHQPIWVTLDPGAQITVISDKEKVLSKLTFHHLCLEGEEAASHMIARLFGVAVETSDELYSGKIIDCFEQLKDYNVKWKRDSLEIDITVYDDGIDQEKRYHLVIDDCYGNTLVAEAYYKDIHDLDVAVSNYLICLKQLAMIEVTNKRLKAPKHVITSWKKRSPGFFNSYIELYKDIELFQV